MLRLDGEPDWSFEPVDHDPEHRAALVAHDGLDTAAVALSSPLGIEALPADEAVELIDAYHRGVMELPTGLRAWAAAGLAEPDPRALAAVLDAGLVGLCLPAGALSGPAAVAHIAPLLATLESRSAAVFIHPGPAPWSPDAPQRRGRTAGLVAGADRLRGADAGGLAGHARVGAPRLPAPARVLRDARRSGAAAGRAPRGARWARRDPRPPHVLRHVLVRPARHHRHGGGRRAGTRWCTAPIVPWSRRRPGSARPPIPTRPARPTRRGFSPFRRCARDRCTDLHNDR